MKRCAWLTSVILLATYAWTQQTKIPQRYRRDFVDARTIAVVASTEPRSSVDPQQNERARLAVQDALRQWGKYEVVLDTTTADLIVVVRKALPTRSITPGPPGTSGPVTLDPGGSGNIGIHRGQDQPLSRPDPGRISSSPAGHDASFADDELDVFLGRTPLSGDASRNPTPYPLNETPAWSYAADGALDSPRLDAVAALRKAVEAAEKKKP